MSLRSSPEHGRSAGKPDCHFESAQLGLQEGEDGLVAMPRCVARLFTLLVEFWREEVGFRGALGGEPEIEARQMLISNPSCPVVSL